MICYEGFKREEAKSSGICSDCASHFCDANPRYNDWRMAHGLQPKAFYSGPTLIPQVEPNPIPFFEHFKPVRGGFKRGCLNRDFETSSIVSRALRVMCEVAGTILNEEGFRALGWRAVSKRGVWATHCSYTAKHVQFGEGSVLCHLEGGRDTVMKEMARFGWEKTIENGWLMIVLHEVAHAVDKKINNHAGHGPIFHRVLRDLRTKYFNRFIGRFDEIRKLKKVAANSEK